MPASLFVFLCVEKRPASTWVASFEIDYSLLKIDIINAYSYPLTNDDFM